MKKFILRLLGSYVLYTILGGLWLCLIDNKYSGFYGKEGSFRWSTVLLYPFEALIGSLLFYFILAYISNKTRVISLGVMLLGFVLIMIYNPNPQNNNIYVKCFYFISTLSIPQFVIPNFHYKENRLDNNKMFVNIYLYSIVVCLFILICYIFFGSN